MSQNNDLILTDGLVARVRALQQKQDDADLMLRVMVNGGGCQGFEYVFGFEHKAAEDDRIFEKDGIRVVIDDTSLELLRGSEIDFVDDLVGASFKIRNPNAKSSCGCGTSFSV